jgi:hypothetical protein
VRQLLSEIDSQELTEWYAYDQFWPISDGWQQTARLCRVVMASSGNYKRVPDEKTFIPAARSQRQSESEMLAEVAKLRG